MTSSGNDSKKYSVVQFITLPYEGIDDYVCVPHNWIVSRKPAVQMVAVAYPRNEHRFITRDRVEREERYRDDWKVWQAALKYQSDTCEDADFWIATRNDYGPIILEDVSINDSPSTSTVNKELRSKMTPEQKLFQKPRTTIKRPPSDGTESQINAKRSKEAKAAEINGTLGQNANADPGCSSMPITFEDGPEIIDINHRYEDDSQQDQQTSDNNENNNNNSQNHTASNMTDTQNNLKDNGKSSSNLQPQITSPLSLATHSNEDEESCARDFSNNGVSTSQHIPVSQSISAGLFEKNNRIFKPGDIPTSSREIRHTPRKSIEKTDDASDIDPRVVLQNFASIGSSSQSLPSSSQRRPYFARRLDEQQNSSALDQCTQQPTREQNAPQRLTEAQRRDPRIRSEHRPISTTTDKERPFIRRPTLNFNPANKLVQRISVPFGKQRILNQRESILSQSFERRPVNTPTIPINCRSTPLSERVIRKPPSHVLTDLSGALRALLATRRNFLSQEELFQGRLKQGTPIINETHPEIDCATPGHENVYQNPHIETQMIDDCKGRNQQLQNDNMRACRSSDSKVGMDHDAVVDSEIPADGELVETTNNVNRSQSTSRFISEQQMMNEFASVSTQMGSTSNYTVNLFETLEASILKIAASYQTLKDNKERFNSTQNLTCQASSSRNVVQEVPLVDEGREIVATERANSNGDQDSTNEASERNSNSKWRFTLPPEYDPNDTRWTLKHRDDMPGLVELLAHSNIYVQYRTLKFCEQISTDCPSLAQQILLEVFSEKALSVCSSITEKGHVDINVRNERPELDEHGCLILLHYIMDQGIQRGWKTDLQPILRGLHNKIIEIRIKFVAMSSC